MTEDVALVTGGSGGIGRAICTALSEDGYTVLVGYAGSADAAAEVAAACKGEAEPVHIDVTDEHSVDAAVRRATELGTLTVAVNNAGATSDALLLRLDPEAFDRAISVNLRGAYLVSRAALRPMLRARFGRIVSIASIVALRGNAGQTAYAAAKAGLIGFTRSLAREVARKGITANVVAPGFVATSMTSGLPDAAQRELVGQAPIGRAVEADEVAAAVSYLVSVRAASVTGVVLPVDGGAGI